MSMTITRRLFLAGTTVVSVTGPAFSTDATHVVEMLNRNPDDKKQRNVFSPSILRIHPGDTVSFVPTDKGHNSVTIDGMLPEGAEPWNGKISKEVSVTYEVPGVYGYKCTPHYGVGMVGLIIVEGEGMLDNADAARDVKHRGKAKKVFADIWDEVSEKGLLAPAG